MSKDKVDQSGFQLDKKKLLEDNKVPMMLKGIAGQFIDFINGLDVNHDGKADLCQIAPFVLKALPFITALAPLVDVDKFVEWFINHDFIKDKELARKICTKLLQLSLEFAAQAGK